MGAVWRPAGTTVDVDNCLGTHCSRSLSGALPTGISGYKDDQKARVDDLDVAEVYTANAAL